MDTRVLPSSDEAIAEAARLIVAGEPVAGPTETVYGLAADATNPKAVARIYEAKGRPSFNPLIVHVPDLSVAESIGQFSGEARALAETHWPGPLTLVVPLRPMSAIASIVTAGLATVGIRYPLMPPCRRSCEQSAALSQLPRPMRADRSARHGPSMF